MTLPQIRRVAGDRFATSLLRQINGNQHFGQQRCPFCNQQMRVFQSSAPVMELDACKSCGLVWFDPAEYEAVPEGAVTSDAHVLDVRGREALATYRLEQVARASGAGDESPDAEWKKIPAIFGLPVESETTPLNDWPLATWGMALAIAAVSIIALFDLQTAIGQFGLIPAESWRKGGFTFVSSFFLHGGVWHLAGNLYFFLIFSDNVEDYLGRWRWALLLLGATFVGDAAHLMADPNSNVPCVGASGGISGIMAFYALKFPQARLSFMVCRFHYWHSGQLWQWLHLPAWGAFAIWMLMQFFIAFMQLSGFGSVSGLAHLGGVIAGVLFWIVWRRLEPRG